MNKKSFFPFLTLLLPLALFAQKAALKPPMFKDLRVTNTITKSYGDSTCVFHVAATDEDVSPDVAKRYFWYHQGEVKNTQGNFTGKLLHGPYEKFDREGTLLEKGTFENGVKDGEWFTWYRNGNMMRHYLWSNGQRTGNFELYDAQGKKSVVGGYKHGLLDGTVYYYNNGVESRKEKYKRGELVKAKEKKNNFWKKIRFKKDSTRTTKPDDTSKPEKKSKRKAKNNEAPPESAQPQSMSPQQNPQMVVDPNQPGVNTNQQAVDPNQQPGADDKTSKARKKKKQRKEEGTVNQ